MKGMFNGCSSLKDLDLTKFNLSNDVNVYSMFKGCSNKLKKKVKNYFEDFDEIDACF